MFQFILHHTYRRQSIAVGVSGFNDHNTVAQTPLVSWLGPFHLCPGNNNIRPRFYGGFCERLDVST